MLFLLLAPFLDLCFNAANSLLHLDRDMQLMLVLLQDTLQVLGLLGIAVRFSSTFVFQVGLIGHLLRRFVATILAALLYLVLTILLHFFSLRDRWNSPSEPVNPSYRYIWPTEVTVLFVLQRTVSILHYVLYKRTVLILADPKYHRESVWLLQKIGKQMND